MLLNFFKWWVFCAFSARGLHVLRDMNEAEILDRALQTKRRSAVSRRAPIDLTYNAEAEAKDRIEQWIPQTIIQCPEITDACLNSELLHSFKIIERLASEMHACGCFLFNIVFIVQHIVTRYCLV